MWRYADWSVYFPVTSAAIEQLPFDAYNIYVSYFFYSDKGQSICKSCLLLLLLHFSQDIQSAIPHLAITWSQQCAQQPTRQVGINTRHNDIPHVLDRSNSNRREEMQTMQGHFNKLRTWLARMATSRSNPLTKIMTVSRRSWCSFSLHSGASCVEICQQTLSFASTGGVRRKGGINSYCRVMWRVLC